MRRVTANGNTAMERPRLESASSSSLAASSGSAPAASGNLRVKFQISNSAHGPPAVSWTALCRQLAAGLPWWTGCSGRSGLGERCRQGVLTT